MPEAPAAEPPAAGSPEAPAAAPGIPQPPPPWLKVGIEGVEFKYRSGKSKDGTWWPGEVLEHVAPGVKRSFGGMVKRKSWAIRVNYINGEELGYEDQLFEEAEWATELRLDPKKDKARLDPRNAKKVKDPGEMPTAKKGKKTMSDAEIVAAGLERGRVCAKAAAVKPSPRSRDGADLAGINRPRRFVSWRPRRSPAPTCLHARLFRLTRGATSLVRAEGLGTDRAWISLAC